MARKNTAGEGILFVLAILLAPFIWAYAVAGWLGVVGLATCIVGAFMLWVWLVQISERPAAQLPAQPSSTWQPALVIYSPDDDTFTSRELIASQSLQGTLTLGLPEIDRLIATGDWNAARAALQRIAYGMVDVDAENKARFTKAMTLFASLDPFYASVMQLVHPVVNDSPGMRQAALYKGMTDEKKELIRYVLYFAAELGQIIRVKKGNSYALYPQGWSAISEPVPALASAVLNDNDISALLRASTEHKSNENWARVKSQIS